MKPGASLRRAMAECVIAGTVGALAMMPFGAVFRALDLRVGHYGPKFAALYLSQPGPLALFVQHLVLGWLSAAVLVLWPLLHRLSTAGATLVGLAYGALYYAAINALALPWYFGDRFPHQLGAAVVLPSLVVHLVFGAAVALTVQALRRRREGGARRG